MNKSTAIAPVTTGGKVSILGAMAAHYGMDPGKFYDTLVATVMPKGTSNEQVAAFMVVSHKYLLDPFTKEIYAFSGQGGAVVPIVGIDGWMTVANRQPTFDGIEFEYQDTDDGKPVSVTAIVYRKDRAHPIKVTEYLAECKRNTAPWNQTPRRMLRHRAAAQCIRYAFGIGGIYIAPEDVEAGEFEVMPERNAEMIGASPIHQATVVVDGEPADTTTGEIKEEQPATPAEDPTPAAPEKPASPRKTSAF